MQEFSSDGIRVLAAAFSRKQAERRVFLRSEDILAGMISNESSRCRLLPVLVLPSVLPVLDALAVSTRTRSETPLPGAGITREADHTIAVALARCYPGRWLAGSAELLLGLALTPKAEALRVLKEFGVSQTLIEEELEREMSRRNP